MEIVYTNGNIVDDLIIELLEIFKEFLNNDKMIQYYCIDDGADLYTIESVLDDVEDEEYFDSDLEDYMEDEEYFDSDLEDNMEVEEECDENSKGKPPTEFELANKMFDILYEKLKKSKKYKAYMQTLYLSSYLLDNLNFVMSGDEDAEMKLKYYDKFNTIDEFIENVEPTRIKRMLFNLRDYDELKFFDKAYRINNLDIKKMLKKCPLLLYDAVYYNSSYNINEVLNTLRRYCNTYFGSVRETEYGDMKEEIINSCADDVLFDMQHIKEDDVKNYLLSELIEGFFLYIRSAEINNEKLEDIRYKKIWLKINEELKSDKQFTAFDINPVDVKYIIRGYLYYKMLPKEKLVKLDDYYKNNESSRRALTYIRKRGMRG